MVVLVLNSQQASPGSNYYQACSTTGSATSSEIQAISCAESLELTNLERLCLTARTDNYWRSDKYWPWAF